MFDAVSVAAAFVSEIETVSNTCVLEWGGSIDEERRFFEVLFFVTFGEKGVRDNVRSSRFKRCLEYFV
jgi:hypothetical protein